MSTVVTARLLGPPEIRIDGTPAPVELLWRKNLALCLILWNAPGRRASRDSLLSMLWADRSESAARHSLNEALRVMRRGFGTESLESTGSMLSWTEPPELDTDLFARLERNDPEAAAILVAGAYCEGLVLDDAPDFDGWLDAERTRWRGRMVDVVVRAARAREDRGDADAASTLARRAVAVDPNSNVAVRALIRSLWLAGDRSAAIAAGTAFATHLRQDLGLPPDLETTELLSRIGRDRRSAGWRTLHQPASRPPLIGYQAELGALRRPDRSAGARLAVVVGPPGSGRSRLLEECVARAELASITVALLRAVPADGSHLDAAALGLANAGLASAPGVATAPPRAIATLVAHSTLWQERFPEMSSAEPLALRDAFAQLVVALSSERPLLLAIDDVDRLHPDELRWLLALLRNVAGHDIGLLVTATVGDASSAMDEMLRAVGHGFPGVVCCLEPVTVTVLAGLVDWAVPTWSDASRDRLTRRLHAESGGLCGIATEVLLAVQRGMSLETIEEWPALDQTFDATLPGALPEPLVAAVRLSFRRLDEETQNMARIAALLEEPFSVTELGLLAEITDPAVCERCLDVLERERWLVSDTRGYSFAARAKRRLVQSEMMTPGHRRRLEARIAKRMEQTHAAIDE